jgi:hypothetical protein
MYFTFGMRLSRSITGRLRSERWKFGFVYRTTGIDTASAIALN